MKKLITSLVILVMLVAFATTAFGFGVGMYAEMVIGENEAVFDPETTGMAAMFIWTAEEAGILTIDFSDEDTGDMSCDVICMDDQYNTVFYESLVGVGASCTLEVQAGDMVNLNIWDNVAMYNVFHFTATFEPAGGGEGGGEVEDCNHDWLYFEYDGDEEGSDLLFICDGCGQIMGRYAAASLIWNDEMTEATATVTVPAGETKGFYAFGISGMMMEVNGEEFGIIPMIDPWTPGVFELTNDTAEDAVYELRLFWPAGSYENPADIPINESFELNMTGTTGEYYMQWVATEDGKIEITVDGEYWIFVLNNEGDPDNYGDDVYGEWHYYVDGASNTDFQWIKAGDLIKITIGTQDENGNFPAADLNVMITFTPGEEPGISLDLGDNAITDGKYDFVATEDGTLYFCITEAQDDYGSIIENLRNAFGNDVVLTINGEPVADGYFGAVEVVAGDKISFKWRSQWGGTYYGTLNLSYENNHPVLGSQERPIEVSRESFPDATVELAPGEGAWYEFSYDLYSAIVTIKGENVIARYSYLDFDQGEVVVEFKPENGVITLIPGDDLRGDMMLEIVNVGTEAAAFEMDAKCAHAYLQHVEAKDPGCDFDGNQEYWICYDCEMVWLDADCTIVSNMKNVIIPAAHTALQHMEAVAPTCDEIGNVECWFCEDCGMVYLDADCTIVTNMKNIVVPPTHTNIVHVEAVAPKCDADGNIEYWYCEACGTVCLDADMTVISNMKNVVAPAAHTNVIHVEALEAACCINGNVEYWYCADCGMVYLDADLTVVSNMKNVVLAYDPANIEYVPYLAPTKEANGHEEYWHCKVCDCVYADAALTIVTNVKNLTVLYQPLPNNGDIISLALVGILMSTTGLAIISKKRK